MADELFGVFLFFVFVFFLKGGGGIKLSLVIFHERSVLGYFVRVCNVHEVHCS